MLMKRKMMALSGAVALLLVLAMACAGGSEPAAAPAPQPDPAAAQPEAAMPEKAESSAPAMEAGTPVYGGAIRTRIAGDLAEEFDLTYNLGKSIPQGQSQAYMYNSLLGFEYGPDVHHNSLILRPELAETWEASADGRSFTFKLRKGVKFADYPVVDGANGRELTSADVKFTYEYQSRTGEFADYKDRGIPNGPFASLFFAGLESIETPDAYTVVVNFKEPFVPFINYAANDFNPVYPREIFDQDGSFQSRAVGTGPFQLAKDKWQRGNVYAWAKNPSYWEPGKPYIDEINWLHIPEDATAFAAFQTKQLDIAEASTIAPAAAQQIAKDNPDAVHHIWPAPTPRHMYMNTVLPPLNDVRVRKAVSLGINRQEIIDLMTGGQGAFALAGSLPDTFTQAEIKKMVRFDPAEAQRMLSDAGYTDGVDIDFTYPGKRFGDAYITEIELMQAQLKKVGIRLNFESLDYTDYAKLKKSRDENGFPYAYQMQTTGKSVQAEVDSYLHIHHSTNKRNYGGLRDDALDALIDQQRREADPVKRKEVIRAAVTHIFDNAYSLAIYYNVVHRFWTPELKNYAPNFGSEGKPLANSWLERQ